VRFIVKPAAKIAIIGGGIGGLTTALTLRQVGFAPEVFEQAPELLEVGAAIALWPNAMRVLEQLGLGEEILRHAGKIEQVRWLDYQGRLLNSVRLPEDKSPSVALHRADLQSVLLHALPSGSVHLGKVFQSLQPQEGHLCFADGSQITYEILIGCDGLHSSVRSQIVADQPPRFRGYTVWRGITRYASTQLETGTAIEVHGNGRRFGIGPVGLNRIGWWATANKGLTRPQQINDHASHDESGSAGQPFDNQHELLGLFQGWWKPINELVAATAATSIVRTDAFDRPGTRKWGQGFVTLLGDAIHPTTPNLGQGGCMAIEDAVVLARCLDKYGVTADALRRYEALRYRRTSSVTGYSRIYGGIGQWEKAWTTGLRNTALTLVPRALARRLFHMVFDYDAYRVRV
jgi:2-polyprenyl-6-methoxyphenol hydroxylase-like FAD-dependent oxidoreductase